MSVLAVVWISSSLAVLVLRFAKLVSIFLTELSTESSLLSLSMMELSCSACQLVRFCREPPWFCHLPRVCCLCFPLLFLLDLWAFLPHARVRPRLWTLSMMIFVFFYIAIKDNFSAMKSFWKADGFLGGRPRWISKDSRYALNTKSGWKSTNSCCFRHWWHNFWCWFL